MSASTARSSSRYFSRVRLKDFFARPLIDFALARPQSSSSEVFVKEVPASRSLPSSHARTRRGPSFLVALLAALAWSSTATAADVGAPELAPSAPALTSATTSLLELRPSAAVDPADDAPSTADPRPENGDDGTRSEVEHVRIGAIGGVGFPRPLAVEGMVKIERVVGLAVEYSVLPNIRVSDVDVNSWALAGDLNIFPFQGGFFIGAKGGRQHVATATTIDAGSYGTASGSMTVDTWFVNPRIGYLKTWNSGFTLGIDAGVQIPISSSVEATASDGLEVPSEVQDFGKKLGQTVLPTIDLLRLGFML